MTARPVTAHTRARREGSRIACPCGAEVTVYHFAWSALVCARCQEPIDKHEWRLSA